MSKIKKIVIIFGLMFIAWLAYYVNFINGNHVKFAYKDRMVNYSIPKYSVKIEKKDGKEYYVISFCLNKTWSLHYLYSQPGYACNRSVYFVTENGKVADAIYKDGGYKKDIYKANIEYIYLRDKILDFKVTVDGRPDILLEIRDISLLQADNSSGDVGASENFADILEFKGLSFGNDIDYGIWLGKKYGNRE